MTKPSEDGLRPMKSATFQGQWSVGTAGARNLKYLFQLCKSLQFLIGCVLWVTVFHRMPKVLFFLYIVIFLPASPFSFLFPKVSKSPLLQYLFQKCQKLSHAVSISQVWLGLSTCCPLRVAHNILYVYAECCEILSTSHSPNSYNSQGWDR